MSWWKIAWKSIQQRSVASLLTGLSMALGVMLVVMVLTIHGVIAGSFKSGSSVGYNMLVGARGGSTQLVLNTVFYLSQPIETIPYDFYLGFADRETREQQMRHSAAYQAEVSLNQSLQLQNQLSLAIPGGAALALTEMSTATSRNDYAIGKMRIHKDGLYNLYASMVIPVCLGDTFGQDSRFRVVATTPAFFNDLEIDVETGEHLAFREGRPFEQWNTEHGVFEAVVGPDVAEAEGLQLGDVIRPIHGDIAAGGHEHRTEFHLVGILERSGTRNDAAVFINMEGFYLMNDHIKPLEDELSNVAGMEAEEPDDDLIGLSDDEFNSQLDEQLESLMSDEPESGDASQSNESESSGDTDDGSGAVGATGERQPEAESEDAADSDITDLRSPGTGTPGTDSPDSGNPEADTEEDPRYLPPLPIEQRELTALLVRGNDETGAGLMQLENLLNTKGMENTMSWSPFRNSMTQTTVQAVSPIREIYRLLELFVNPIQIVLLALTIMICVVSGIGILVSIYNSMSERKHEIAIMRALGADQTTVMGVILAESVILSLLGGLVGWLMAHLVVGLAAPIIRVNSGVSINPLSFAPGIPIPGLPGVELSTELLLVPGLMLLAILVGLLPAISAYRTDVSENLN